MAALLQVIQGAFDAFNSGRALPVPTGVGEWELQANSKPPRVIAIPDDDTYGGGTVPGALPRQARTRTAEVDFHVWGADLNTVEDLTNDLITAIHSIARGSYSILSGKWVTNLDPKNWGAAYVLRASFDIPVVPTNQAETAAKVTSVSSPTNPPNP